MRTVADDAGPDRLASLGSGSIPTCESDVVPPCLHPFGPAQRGDRRPRRPRQDHPGRRHPPPGRRVPAPRQEAGVAERVMDSMDLEREQGITILAKNTAIHYRPTRRRAPRHVDQHRRHPRPRRLRWRGRARPVDGRRRRPAGRRLRGPAAADPLRAAQGARSDLPVILVVNKTDRSDARIAEVVDETYELFLELLEEHRQPGQPRLPDRLRIGQGRSGLARRSPANGTLPDAPTSSRWSRRCSTRSPRPSTTPRSRCARRSPTSTPRRTSAGSRCCASTRAR